MSKEPPQTANVDPVIAAMAAAVAYDHEHSPQDAPTDLDPTEQTDRPRRPLHKIGAKKRNWCWNWFAQDDQDKNIAICDYCGRSVRRLKSDRGSPKKLLEHLHTHKITPEMENPGRKQASYTAGAESFYHSIQKRKKARPQTADTPASASHNADPSLEQHNQSLRDSDQNAEHDRVTSATALFAFRTLRFLLENDVYLRVIFSPSWGELVGRYTNSNIDAFLRQLETQFDAEGVSRCMATLNRLASMHTPGS